tara:strand:+ start:242 stop:529 length:288 start_codon:yes stop_codon:yes gene_type:complete
MRPVGVNTKKKINAITNGDTIEPKKKPNLIQALFKGESSFEFKTPNIKKIIAMGIGQLLIPSPFIEGQKAIMKKIIAKKIPKILFDPVLILLFFI